MISFDKRFATVLLIALISFVYIDAKDIYCYRLTKSSDVKIKVGVYQFISFVGDQCFESDKNGRSVGNGTMNKNDYLSDSIKTIYNGTCFCGSEAKYEFTANKARLTVFSSKGNRYSFERVLPPSGVQTCSFIKEKSSGNNYNYYNDNYQGYTPIYVNGTNHQNINNQQSTNSNRQTIKQRRKCSVCNGTGRIGKNDNAPSNLGIEKPKQRCNECGELINPNLFIHYHVDCRHCHGTGYVD